MPCFSKNMSNRFADISASYGIKKGGSSVEKKIKRTRKRGCTKTKKNNVDNIYFYLGAYSL